MDDYLSGEEEDDYYYTSDQESLEGLDHDQSNLQPLSSSGNTAKVITKESLLAAQREDLRRVMELLTLKEHHARTLLIHHRWDVEKLFAVLVEKGKDYLFSGAGLTLVEDDPTFSPSSPMMMTCDICVEDVATHHMTRMDCGHCFCNNCWAAHFTVKITEGQSKRIRCMAYKCNAICDEDVVRSLVSETQPDLADKFDRFLIESYIEDNKMVKWCPSTPHCGNAIRVEDDELCEVECSCGFQFCFSCSYQAHSPCSCSMWELWRKKCHDESETVNWITVHTKPCPKCFKPVEKNGGCNLVTCICGQSFCWLCGGATGRDHTWSSISGHSCGRYQEDKEKQLERAKRDLYRYMHYHNRYKAHIDSSKLEDRLSDTILEKVSILEKRQLQLRDFSWVTSGLHRLFRSRRVLSYSYPFAFYMFGEELFKDEMSAEEREIKQNLFEDQQQQLEVNVEKLSKFLEEPFDQFADDKVTQIRIQVINLSVAVDTLCKTMYECIDNDLLGSLQLGIHNIAPYRTNGIERASDFISSREAAGEKCQPSNSGWNSEDTSCSPRKRPRKEGIYRNSQTTLLDLNRSSEYVLVRENKGFCGICMKTIMLIENAPEANKDKVQVDFDDQGSWEYLFKIYWVSLKEKLSLSLDDLTKAKNPWKPSKRRTTSQLQENDDGVIKLSLAKLRKMEAGKLDSNSCLGDRLAPLTGTAAAWATDELLDFVRYMKNGDVSVLSKYDVQTLVLEYVRRNSIQNASQDSEIVCDPRLMRLFGKERVDHLEMLKILDSHFLNQERSPVTDTETMSFQVDDRLNASEQHQEGESQRPSSAETRAALYNKPIDELDLNMIWLYGDPDGKIHGPFSLMNLRQWSSSGHFPPELRIWRLGEQKNRSILLTDALNGQFHKTGLLQNHSIPKQEETATIANVENRSVAVAKLESRVLDFSPNSVSTDQSVISSSNSVITRGSDASNRSENLFSQTPLDFTHSNEREAVGNKLKIDSPLPGQSPISCSLSLSTFPGNSNSNCTPPPQQERWNVGHTEADGNTVKKACNQNDTGLSGSGEKQVTATVQSCGQNWSAATPSSASNVWDSNPGLVSFTDNQEIDFLDLFSPTFKFNFASDTTEWQPIVTGPDECDESVSDLLAEVEAMESQKRLPSPTSTYRGPGELTRHSINDSFSPVEGHSPALDVSKGDSMSSTNDLQMHLRTNNPVDF